MAHLRLRLLLALALVFVCPLPVVALEILDLTGGSISVARSNSSFAIVEITGPRLQISTLQQQVNGGYDFRCSAPPDCLPGMTHQVGGRGVGSDFIGGLVTFDGVGHPLTGQGLPGFDFLSLFLSASVLIPEFGSIESVVLAAPFDLTGKLSRSHGDNCHPIFGCSGPDRFFRTEYELRGQGIFHGAMHRVNLSGFGDHWQWDSARFDLQPTPEPATLLLFGTTAAGLGVARYIRKSRSRRLTMLGLALVLMLPASASAIEILVLDGGSMSNHFDSAFGTIDFHGPRLRFSGIGQTFIPAWFFRICTPSSFGPCAPGGIFPIGGNLGGSDIFGTATLDGVANIVANNSAPAADSLGFTITGFFPVPPIGGATGAVLTGPFSLSGEFFRGCGFIIKPCEPFGPGGPHPIYGVEGHGLYTLSLELVYTPAFGDAWQWTSVEFDLQPTPEPATLLLWGTGAAGLGLVRWVRRRRAWEGHHVA